MNKELYKICQTNPWYPELEDAIELTIKNYNARNIPLSYSDLFVFANDYGKQLYGKNFKCPGKNWLHAFKRRKLVVKRRASSGEK